MTQAFPEAAVLIPGGLPEAFKCIPDPKDRHVLCAAVRGQANVIVTLNKRDFPVACLEEYGILRHTPDEFLVHQHHLNPNKILETLDAQAFAFREDRGLSRIGPLIIAC